MTTQKHDSGHVGAHVRAHVRAIDAHFAGHLSPRAERAMRERLPGCAPCRARYQRHLLLADIDPRALPADERLGRGLGLWRPSPPARVLVPVLALGTLALLLVLGGRAPSREFAARGGSSPYQLAVYRVGPNGSATPVGPRIAASDELAFAYTSGSDAHAIAVFAVDEHRHIYWYHPAWQRAAEDPQAVAIVGDGHLRELPAAVRHPLDGRRLRLYGLFLPRPLSVRQVEEYVRAGGFDADALQIPGARQISRLLQVTP